MDGYTEDLWWMLLLKGILLLLLGIMTLAWPGLTLGLLIAFFSFYLLFGGVLNIIMSISRI